MKNMVMENPRPYRTENILVHGLISCNNRCGYWNRDVNGATNIYKIAYNAMNIMKKDQVINQEAMAGNALVHGGLKTKLQATHQEAIITHQGFWKNSQNENLHALK